uniref:Uncharacterized protein n=1 Tax=Mucochytrium quahogii TaxID=96639 RepID=A0A7S2RB65_9STRA
MKIVKKKHVLPQVRLFVLKLIRVSIPKLAQLPLCSCQHRALSRPYLCLDKYKRNFQQQEQVSTCLQSQDSQLLKFHSFINSDVIAMLCYSVTSSVHYPVYGPCRHRRTNNLHPSTKIQKLNGDF